MYNEMMNQFQAQMAPFTKAAEINKQTAEKLFGMQQTVATEMLNRGLEHVKALTESKEPKAALELQVAFFKEMEAKLNTVAEEEISALMTAKAELTEIFEKSTQEMTEEAMAQFSKFDLAKFDLAQFDLAKFDMKNFDLSNFMPSVEAAKPAAKTTRKAAAPKATA
jgi:hypothetical protein